MPEYLKFCIVRQRKIENCRYFHVNLLRDYLDRNTGEKVFVVRNFIEVRIPLKHYRKLEKRYPLEYIVSMGEPRRVISHVTKRNLEVITRESGIPLMGNPAFGVIDRGTNLLQVRGVTGCNFCCAFCSVDEGKCSKTRVTDYVVEASYLAEWVEELAKFKGRGVEVHLDGQGEPMLYPYMEELLERIRKIREVSVISMQTNGSLLKEENIEMLEKYVDRINLSLSSMDRKVASFLAGVRYPLERILDAARMVAESRMDLLIAPVWVPGYNDRDIKKIIEFALEIGAGKKWPPLGIQKYIPYRYGRKVKTRPMSFPQFYAELRELEKKYGIKLILSHENLKIKKRERYPSPLRRGERFRARIVLPGRMRNERIVTVRNRTVTVRTSKRVGEFVDFVVTRTHDGIYLGEEV